MVAHPRRRIRPTYWPLVALLLGLLSGCPSEQVQDISSSFGREVSLEKGYVLGGEYTLVTDLFVTDGDWPDYHLTKPGDGVPMASDWLKGTRVPQTFMVISLLPAGSQLRVEKIIFLRPSGSGVSHATGMLRADGVDKLISPFSVSEFLNVAPYGALCLPDPRFLQKTPSSASK